MDGGLAVEPEGPITVLYFSIKPLDLPSAEARPQMFHLKKQRLTPLFPF